MIHIAFCINDKFSMPLEVLIYSITNNTRSKLSFHILYKSLSQNNIQSLEKRAKENNAFIQFYDLSNYSIPNLIIRNDDRVTIETYFRFLLPDLICNVDKILYMDADILCINDISKIESIDISNTPVAMCYDQNFSNISYFNRLNYSINYGYYNAGVMYINLDYWRKNNLKNLLLDFVIKNPDKCICHDQDAINAVLYKSIKTLPIDFNFQHIFFNVYGWINLKKYQKKFINTDFIKKEKWDEILEASKHPVLIHYSCPFKPWHKNSYAPFTLTWRIYYEKTFNKTLKPISRYENNFKNIKIAMHNLLSILHFIPKILYPIYPEEASEIEQNYLTNYIK